MPIHDWTKVEAGIFCDFHGDWIQVLKHTLNDGLLPADYYALSEQVAAGVEPDVIALRDRSSENSSNSNGSAVCVAEPKTRFNIQLGSRLPRKRNQVAIRHISDDKVVAVIEIVSPGNKDSRNALRSFVSKSVDLLAKRIHLLVIDLFPPTSRDPNGIHAVVQDELAGTAFELPADKPLTLAAYEADIPPMGHVEPVAVGDFFPDMPLYLFPGGHVPLPLEKTYLMAWEGVPLRWRKVIDPELG
jgi:hypothetical protein